MSICLLCNKELTLEDINQVWPYHLGDFVLRKHQLNAGDHVCYECYKKLEADKAWDESNQNWEICDRCKGFISYEIQEEDGFQFIASICPCATERTVVNSHNIRYYERLLAGNKPAKPADQFIKADEMRL